ncbi:alpha/beta hydrolase family protein [Flavobacterium crocinum]|nr:prolyl oligopeptidase family serine peptidase [Flavobacterium crocinum]
MIHTGIKNIAITLFRALAHVFFILPLVTCPVSGQAVQKRKLTFNDYKLWGQLRLDKSSPDSHWISYAVQYENDADTLFVASTAGNEKYALPSGSKSLFTKENIFIFMKKNELHVLDPVTGRNESFESVSRYEYSMALNKLIILCKEKDNTEKLITKSPLADSKNEITGVSDFSLSPNGELLAYSFYSDGKNSALLFDLRKNQMLKSMAQDSKIGYKFSAWSRNSRALVFNGQSGKKSSSHLYYYVVTQSRLYVLDAGSHKGLKPQSRIINSALNPILIADDLEKVLFSVGPDKKKDTIEKPSVEIWNGNDKWVYGQNERYGRFDLSPKLMLWKPKKESLLPITSETFPSVMLSRDLSYAVLSNPKQYEPQFEHRGPRDYYILDLDNFQKDTLLLKQSAALEYMYGSSNGKYISYFKDNDWWAYNVKRKTHVNLSGKLKYPFYGKVNLLASDDPYGNPGWSRSNDEILLYDEFDIWALKPDGSSARRLTRGREKKIRFRLHVDRQNFRKSLYDAPLNETFDLNDELYLSAAGDDGKTGYWSWSRFKGEKEILFTDSYVDRFIFNVKTKTAVMVEQKFNIPPRIISKKGERETRVIVQSNPQQVNYFWGKTELVTFQNSKKQNLKGVLYYPADYKPSRDYPMIVGIYEKQSHLLHQYINPTLLNEPGYNSTVFTAEGYFVFRPDIIHENENVGFSTLDCVESGTRKIIEMGLVNPKRIALMGHSFGGYETAFVINHSDLFATAVASGGIFDLTRRFLTFGANMAMPEMWRFSSGGWRLGKKTPFSDRLDFDRNSPLESVTNLNIPLLMWCGKEDTQVDPFQSMEYYLALRRLGKKCIFLQYPKEDHTLMDPMNQEDLSLRILQWFDYFLKDQNKAEWITAGTL